MNIIQVLTSSTKLFDTLENSCDKHIEDATFIKTNVNNSLREFKKRQPKLVLIELEPNIISFVKEIKKSQPNLPIIILNTTQTKGDMITTELLSLGVSQIIDVNISANRSIVNINCVDKVLKCVDNLIKMALNKQERVPPVDKDTQLEIGVSDKLTKIELVVIGASTGGVTGIEYICKSLPANFPIPVIVIFHMDEYFSQQLCNKLKRVSHLPVHLVSNNESILPNNIYIAKGGEHLKLVQDEKKVICKLDKGPKVNFCRPSVDVTLLSADEIYKQKLMTIILSGMGQDGLEGCRAVNKSDGLVIVQDKETSIVWSMPGVVASNGLANKILPEAEIGTFICDHISQLSAIFYRG